MKSNRKNIVGKLLLLLICSFAIAFCTNWYMVQANDEWQADSEELIWGRIGNAVQNGLLADGGFIGEIYDAQGKPVDFQAAYDETTPEGSSYSVYDRQVGLQGTVAAVFAVLAKNAGISAYFVRRILWITTTGMMVFVLMLLAKWTYVEWGGQRPQEH